ncbi:hypothetical protein EUGRSUZ_I01755 [Eucalyptus grandis]|uniref:Uncharacterized protein n=1 Tax=Eucalyptus grandis TaxID=71139 RepID=A0ACC3JGA6_EUCGR|nr:hypothetical protein EUGRSUZ_I01755 [Eucalyptus grandis]
MAPSLSNAGSDVSTLVNGHTDSVITLEDSNFLANGHVILSDVPSNVTVSPSAYHASGEKALGGAGAAPGCFVGFDAAEPRSHHVASIGKLQGIRFMSIFRFKVWWTTHWVGTNGRDLEHETQMVILDRSDEGSEPGAARPYVLLLPLLEGPFRASIQPGPDDFVDLCVESGSTKVTAAGFRAALYMHAGDDPFALVKEAIKVARDHLGTFKLLEEKTPPGIVDKFGWCTWDAFYLTVHPEGIWDGVKGLVEGGCPPGLVLIDDGWQSISHDEDPVNKEGMNHAVAGEQMPCRLLKFQENHKFRDYASPSGGKGMGAFVRDLKEEFGSGCHMVHCAYNSLWMGNFIHPDWDMFQSTHPCALFHAASRAISGGPIYISDALGKHDFELLRRLVLPDGSILRCEHYALPTRDCLFVDPLHDGKTMLKIWNLNKYTGVIGAFNCQGGGWCRESRRNKCASQFSHAVSCTTKLSDIEWSAGGSMISVDGVRVFALYLSQSKRLVLSKPSESLDITLEPFQFELVTVSPVKELRSASARGVQFAPIGLVNMLNAGGAIQGVEYGEGRAEIEVRGGGEFKAFASERPRECRIDGRPAAFEYEGLMVVVQVPWPGSSSLSSVVEYLF